MLDNTKQTIKSEISKYAKRNIIKKLEKQDIDYTLLENEAFNELVEQEIKILKSDTKKVGTGIAIGILITLVTGI